MKLKSIVNRLTGQKERLPLPEKSIDVVLAEISNIRENSDTIAFCADNTGSSWLGIKQATIGLFKTSSVCIPHYYSHSLYNKKELAQINEQLSSLNFKHIVWNGVPLYFLELAESLSILNKDIKQYVFYHGPASELADATQLKIFTTIVSACKKGIIHKLAVNKLGYAEAISSLYGIRCERFLNKTIVEKPATSKKINPAALKIGVLGGDSFSKNVYTQVFAALQIPGASIHVLNKNVEGLPQNHRIVNHTEKLSHSDFLELLGSMDINLHLSFSESWGLVTTESLAMGVPCLITAGGNLFENNPQLRIQLEVTDYDNIQAIAAQIKRVLENHKILSDEGIKHVSYLNTMADKHLQNIFKA